jgi:uncharacterized protein (TIGR03437 family)
MNSVRIFLAFALAVGLGAQTFPSLTPLKVVEGLQSPTMLTSARDGSGRIYVVEQQGRIRILRDGRLLDRPFLDINSKVLSGGERGLLSVAFPPGYASKGYFYIDYTDQPNGNTVVARYRITSDPELADPASEQILFTVTQPFANHNGGMLAFSPHDGHLYIGMGDGGSAGDPQNNGQNPQSLLGKLLRMDTESGNPAPSPEIWALGLRNPWRFSFDRDTGDLWVGDVGQDRYEEIDFQPAATGAGVNYGWRRMEGLHCYETGCSMDGLTLPVFEYDHSQGCSVTGGYLYRGKRWPALRGWYIFADYCSGNLWALQLQNSAAAAQIVMRSGFNITSFGEDEQGELYFADAGEGAIYQLASGNPSVTAAGVVNAASFNGTATAGSLASLFGVGLTTVNGSVTATQFPLPTSLSGTSLTLDGIAAPLLAVANVDGLEQINFQVPWELDGRTQASLVVTNNGTSSAPITIPLSVQPGLFAGSRDGTLLQLWATGLGPVLTTPATGQAATVSSIRDPVQVLVNGAEATVEYAGLAPGFAGLYQVNARLADSIPAGPLDVGLRAGGSDSNTLQVQ